VEARQQEQINTINQRFATIQSNRLSEAERDKLSLIKRNPKGT
jgi:hypothetical protein